MPTTGKITFATPLTDAQYYYLGQFCLHKHMLRKAPLVKLLIEQKLLEDPLRAEAGLPLGFDACWFLGGQGELGDQYDASVINKASPPRPIPSPWCSWMLNTDRQSMHVRGELLAPQWAKFLIQKLLSEQWGIRANGVVSVKDDIIRKDNSVFVHSTLWLINDRKIITVNGISDDLQSEIDEMTATSSSGTDTRLST